MSSSQAGSVPAKGSAKEPESDGDCTGLRKESLRCVLKHPEDKEHACAEQFKRYSACMGDFAKNLKIARAGKSMF